MEGMRSCVKTVACWVTYMTDKRDPNWDADDRILAVGQRFGAAVDEKLENGKRDLVFEIPVDSRHDFMDWLLSTRLPLMVWSPKIGGVKLNQTEGGKYLWTPMQW